MAEAADDLLALDALGVEVVEEQAVQREFVRHRLLTEVQLAGFDGLALPRLKQAQLAVFPPSVVRSVLHSLRRGVGSGAEGQSLRDRRKLQMASLFLRSLLGSSDALSEGGDEEEEEEGEDLVSAVVAREQRQLEDGEVQSDEQQKEEDEEEEQPMQLQPFEMPDLTADVPKVTSVQCPICNEQVQVREGDSVDRVLDQHLDRCSRRHARRAQTQQQDMTVSVEEASDENDDGDYVEENLDDLADDRPARSRKRKVAAAADVVVEAYEWDDFDDTRFAERVEQLPAESLQTLENGRVVDEAIYQQLQPHQQQGLTWMWGLYTQQVGGILADEMGLGKTAQVCAHCDSIRRTRPAGTQFLIVTPATVLRHWEKEFHRWAPRIRVLLFHPINPTFKVISALGLPGLDRALARATGQGTPTAVIVSYEGMKRYQDVLLAYEWTAAVLDEGQKIRNPDANITIVCKQIPASHRIIASGTPIQNSLRELWSLFDFAYPNKLGPLRLFELDFVEPLRAGGYRNASALEARVAVHTAQTLQAILRPYMLRRKKKDISMHMTLPRKTEQVLFCKLTPLQRDIYKQVLNSDEVQALLRRGARLTAFRAITTLRKLCNHPSFVYQNGEIRWSENDANDQLDEDAANNDVSTWKWADSGKLVVLKRVLTMWIANNHRSLIFSQTRILLNAIEEMCRQEGWSYLRMDGMTSMKKRQTLIDTFNQDSSIPLMLLTTRTGGLGISLTGADRVVLVDPDWNPQTDIQARERAWRIGQTKPVTIFRLITRGTIEEKIYQRQIFKTLLSNQVLDNPKQQRLFSRQYLRELFELQEVADEHVGYDVQLPDQGVLYKSEVVNQQLDVQRDTAAEEADEDGGANSSSSASNKQEGMVLAALFSGEDVAAVFQHDVLESEPGVVNGVPTTVIDAEARRRVQDAIQALQRSTNTAAATSSSPQQAASSASASQQPVFSSSSLLRAIRAPAAGGSGSSAAANNSTEVVLAKRLVQLLKSSGPLPSARLLRHFQDLRDQDAPIFREVLRAVASLSNKSWRLKDAFEEV